MKYTTVNVHLSTLCNVMAGVQPLAGPGLAVRIGGRGRPDGDDSRRFRVEALAARRAGC